MTEGSQQFEHYTGTDAEAKVVERKQPNYMAVFVALTLLTLVEVLVTYTPLPRLLVLLPLAVVKAGLVVLYYMHLRYDKSIFGALFMMGVLMGLILIVSLALLFGPPLFGVRP
jgi:caa(3)-type oxidase subunit IV